MQLVIVKYCNIVTLDKLNLFIQNLNDNEFYVINCSVLSQGIKTFFAKYLFLAIKVRYFVHIRGVLSTEQYSICFSYVPVSINTTHSVFFFK